jgi:hypothetical protein
VRQCRRRRSQPSYGVSPPLPSGALHSAVKLRSPQASPPGRRLSVRSCETCLSIRRSPCVAAVRDQRSPPGQDVHTYLTLHCPKRNYQPIHRFHPSTSSEHATARRILHRFLHLRVAVVTYRFTQYTHARIPLTHTHSHSPTQGSFPCPPIRLLHRASFRIALSPSNHPPSSPRRVAPSVSSAAAVSPDPRSTFRVTHTVDIARRHRTL